MALRPIDDTWQRRASCRGPESALFYPPAASEGRPEREVREARAKVICAACPVQAPCLEYALQTQEPHGIWGGLTETERRPLSEWRAG